jgi:uncharacterized alpha-E superfamily protein
MKVSVKHSAINEAFAVLQTAKIANFDIKDQKAVFSIARTLRPLVEKFNADADDVRKRLQPDGWGGVQQLAEKVAAKIATKEEAQAYAEKALPYISAVQKHLADLENEFIEVEITAIDETLAFKLLDASDWNISALNALDFIITTSK